MNQTKSPHQTNFIVPSGLINLIKKDVDSGYGIVPLIGAGFSAPSGIPAGVDYTAYLFYCLAKVFGSDGTCKVRQENNLISQWNPASLRWPDFSEVPIYENLWDNMKQWSEQILSGAGNFSVEGKMARWQAAGVVSDWRATLHLLSRLRIEKGVESDESKKVVLRFPDNRVIDSFFVTLTKGKKPNAAHMFLPHLADILRIKIILTTNFDNLIENAFQQFDMPIAVFDVHMDASLPDPGFVRSQRSVVKMHGGRYGLRADFTLDKYPSSDDVEKFKGYMSLYNSNQIKMGENQRNLLVLGVGGKEHRTIALICRTMMDLSDLKVYWLCYHEDEKNTVRNTFTYILSHLRDRKEIMAKDIDHILSRIYLTNTPYLSLFFLEFYQNIFLSLPPAGLNFPAIWPIPPMPPEFEEESDEAKSVNKLIKTVKDYTTYEIDLSEHDTRLSLISSLFYKIATELHCICIDFYPGIDELDFAYSVIESCAIETGHPDFQPSVDAFWFKEKKYDHINKQLLQIIQKATRKFILFINLKITPEDKLTDTEKLKELTRKYLRKLIDNNLSNDVQDKNYKPDIRYLIIENSSETAVFNFKEWFSHLFDKNGDYKFKLEENNIQGGIPAKIIPDIENYLKSEVFKRFILALSLTRNINLISLLHSWAFIKAPQSLSVKLDNDPIRYYMAKVCLQLLREKELIRDDNGYYVHMPVEVKKAIQEYLKNDFVDEADYYFICSESHQGIADWHMKLYRASGDIRAAFEATYHRLCCIRDALKMANTGTAKHEKSRLIITSLIEIDSDLDMAKVTAFKNVHLSTLTQRISKLLEDIEEIALNKQISNNEWYFYKLTSIECKILNINQTYYNLIYAFHSYNRNNTRLHKYCEEPIELQKTKNNLFDKREDKNHVYKCYGEAKRYMVQRNYTEAENNFKEALLLMEFGDVLNLITNQARQFEQRRETVYLRSQVRKWIMKGSVELENSRGKNQTRNVSLSQNILSLMVKILRNYQQLKLFQAQINRYYADLITDHTKKEAFINKENNYLQQAEKIYITSTEILRYFKDLNSTYKFNALIRTNTGIMLSRMRRHVEAYRRYNEAYSYLNFGQIQGKPIEFAIIDLRRAETFLSQLEQMSEKKYSEEMKMVKFGLLFDAIASIERAEYKMKGTTVNSWWFNWLYEQQLNICIEITKMRNSGIWKKYKSGDKYDAFARCRDCEVCGIRFRNNLESGSLISGSDLLRNTRFLKLSFDFLSLLNIGRISSSGNSQVLTNISNRMNDLIIHINKLCSDDIERDQFILDYAEKVLRKINISEENKPETGKSRHIFS